MLYPVPFEAEHFAALELQAAQAHVSHAAVSLTAAEGLYAVTLMEDVKPLLCCGAFEMWRDRAYLWAALGSRVNAKIFPRVFSYAKAWIENLPFKRLEAAVDCNFENGHRLVRALGFECEAPRMRAFVPGFDHALYARVKGG